MSIRTDVTSTRVECPYCPMRVYRGNLERHVRACLRRATAKRRRAMLRELRG